MLTFLRTIGYHLITYMGTIGKGMHNLAGSFSLFQADKIKLYIYYVWHDLKRFCFSTNTTANRKNFSISGTLPTNPQ